MRRLAAKGLLAALPPLMVIGAVEAYVRLAWNPKQGTPGLYLSDPELVQRFAPHYAGWFAGVPVRINNLGHHDLRDYSLEKRPGTWRILVVGDSVAFGHGSVYEHTYPYLLEQRLKAWRPEVDWQVWNAGVPGYNSAQELAYLRRYGPAYRPDLVIVGFHPNDVVNNEVVRTAGRAGWARAAVRNWVRGTFRSYEWYRRLILQARWRLFASGPSRTLLENLAAEDSLLAANQPREDAEEQRLTDITPLTDEALARVNCRGRGDAEDEVARFQQEPAAQHWREAIRAFQQLHLRGEFRLVFFVNTAPNVCREDDLFFDGGSRVWNDFFVRELDQGVPTISTYDAIMRYRPSQMPEAAAHALGNVNRLKADLLFVFLRQSGFADRVSRPRS
ncbi:MAG: SGNH/GDSL hydrolase family protein [Acidobacteriota bacterium]